MPQIQVLPPGQTFGSQLGSALGTGLSQGIGAGLSEMLQQKQQQRKMSDLLGALGIRSDQNPSARNEISNPSQQMQSGGLQQLTQEQILAASIMNPQLAPALGAIYKNQQKEAKEKDLNTGYTKTLDEMDALLSEGKAGRSANVKSFLKEELREPTARFESLGVSLLGLAQQKALKQGIRNQKEFEAFMKKTIPSANDTIGTARGKINALREYLESETGAIPSVKKDANKSAKTFSSLPPAKEYAGKKVRDTDTGRIFQSDGIKWSEVK
jgi:hypothetical protein